MIPTHKISFDVIVISKLLCFLKIDLEVSQRNVYYIYIHITFTNATNKQQVVCI